MVPEDASTVGPVLKREMSAASSSGLVPGRSSQMSRNWLKRPGSCDFSRPIASHDSEVLSRSTIWGG